MTATAKKSEKVSIQIPARKFPTRERMKFLPKLAGPLMMQFEAHLFKLMDEHSNGAYKGGYWEMYEFPNGALMMVYEDLTPVKVTQPANYFEGEMSLLVLSMALNLHLCSNLSFHPRAPQSLGQNYHLLMDNFHDWADNGWAGVPAEFTQMMRFLD